MPKTIVITGSTRGIGFGLADAFLSLGQRVFINGRGDETLALALESLKNKHGADHLHGLAADISHPDKNQILWDAAVGRFGEIDIWINNAGINQSRKLLWEISPAEMKTIVDVNLLGMMYGARVAMNGMIRQGHGHIYNMEGSGSGGEIRRGVSLYGATKYSLSYFTKALRKEGRDTPVKVSTISPGIVITDFIFDAYKENPGALEKAKRIFNILGDKPESVTPWLAKRVLENEKSGARIAWLTTPKIMFRFMTAGFRHRDLFSKTHGSPVHRSRER